MSSLTFTLKSSPAQRIDCSLLTPDLLTDKSVTDIAAIELVTGNSTERVDSLFDILGDDASNIKFVNSTDKLDFIGRNMTLGKISVDGNVGGYLGLFLDGGQIEVTGDTGVYTACEMKSGQIKINGNAGEFVGGARPGYKNGMTGGIVIVT
ncbi:MAG: formylmethanofuran dehydrogenase subunit C, partial [Gammaproteobacteria bacterium]